MLAVPVSRRAVVAGKALGVAFSTGLVVAIVTIAALAGDAAWETGLGVARILSAGAGLGLLGLFFGGLTMAIWTLGGSAFPAARVTAVVAMATFLLNGLGALSDALSPARVLSPFYWYFGDTATPRQGLRAHLLAAPRRRARHGLVGDQPDRSERHSRLNRRAAANGRTGSGSPDGIRTRVTGLKGRRPRPLDDGALPRA